jgi:hypothetical protein
VELDRAWRRQKNMKRNRQHRKFYVTAGAAVIVLVGSLLAASASPALAAGNPELLPSVHCMFTEPFITILVSREGLIVQDDFTSKKSVGQFVTAYSADPDPSYTFRVNGKLQTLTISNEVGSDGMSEFIFARKGRWGDLVGGCSVFPNGFAPRRVTKVADDDVLNVRAQARVGAKVVATAINGQWIFVKPSSKVWRQVAVMVTPKNESGAVVVVRGWANSKFITTK